MPGQKLNILLVEDNVADADLIEEALSDVSEETWASQSFELIWVPRLSEGLKRLVGGKIDAVLLDLSLPDSLGMETFRRVRQGAPRLPIVVLSGLQDEALAARAVREGAQDYLVKGQVDGPLLVRAIRYAIERKQAEEERDRLVRAEIARLQAEEAQRRLAFLAEASRELASSLNYEATLGRVAELAARDIADCCIIHGQDETGEIRHLAAAYSPAVFPEGSARSEREPVAELERLALLRQVLHTGRPVLLPQLGSEAVSAFAPLRELGATSAIIAPIVLRGRTLGAITLALLDRERWYDQADLALADDLAGRVALAMDNAILYQEVRQQVRSRDEFLAAASHDLKNPLVSIKGNAQVLQRLVQREGELDRERVATGLTRIDDAATRMTALLDDLLEVTRVQMGQPLALQYQATDLVALAKMMASDLEQTSERHHIVVASEEAEVVGLWDPARLERVIGNLLSNAIKYSPEGGQVYLSVAREERQGTEGALLRVQDQGIGIPAADLPHIFDRFHRADNVVGKIAGTGIGLASTRQVVEQHGGTIWVDSREGEGTTLMVWLPLCPRESPEAVPVPQRV